MGDGTGTGAGTEPRVRAPVPAGPAQAAEGGGEDQVGRTRVEVAFSIPLTLPTLNVLLRMHWSKRRKLQELVAWECMCSMRHAGIRIAAPIARCDIRVVRHSRREPDADGLSSTAKLLLDALQPVSITHPCGLGVIVDDGPKCIRKLTVQHAKALRIKADGHLTQVFVTEVCDELPDDR